MPSESRHVLLAVCGGIAAYKACEVLRGLQKAGCEVRVTMTADAERFVGPATFEGLKSLRGPEEVARVRGKSVEEIVG